MEISTEDFKNKDKAPLKLVETYYKILKIIGKGAFGVVYKAFELCSGRIVAIKQIAIDFENRTIFKREIELLKNLEHPNIVKYYNYLKEENYIYIIMEYLEGDTLRKYLKENSDKINEDIARTIIKQLLNALSYLHYSCDVCHRDIKPENIMFKEKDDISCVKLLDFGLSSDSFESKIKMRNCGTLTYMAPEQISSLRYSKAVDIWSVGVVLYMLLNKGKNPFYNKGDSQERVIEKINNKEIEFDLENCPISAIGRHLIYKLLDKNPAYRYSARLALSHPWITMNKYDKIPMTLYDKSVEDENVNKLKMLLFMSLFILSYKNKNLRKKSKNLNKRKKNNSDLNEGFICVSDNEDLKNNYEKELIKSNQIYAEKFKEDRDKMFLPKYKTAKDINYYLLRTNKTKSDKKLNDDMDKSNEVDENMELFSNKGSDNDEKEDKSDLGEIKHAGTLKITLGHKKSILKKSKICEKINNYKDNRLKKSLNTPALSPDINCHLKRCENKLMSNKLISFRLSVESKDLERKKRKKTNIQKPIKLQSIFKSHNQNGAINISKSFKSLNKGEDVDVKNSQNEFELLANKSNKSTKNVERDQNENRAYLIQKGPNNRKLIDMKVSYSFDHRNRNNKLNEDINKKNLNYKPIKFKGEYEDKENRIGNNIFSSKSKYGINKRLSGVYLTSIKKAKYSSMDKPKLVQPKILFQNNKSILPPIQKK